MRTRTLARNVTLMTLVILLALVGATLAAPATQRAQAQEETPTPIVDVSDLLTTAQNEGSARVIVGVDAAFAPEGNLSSPQAVQTQRQRIERAQDVVLNSLAADAAQVVHQYEFIPFMALEADAAALEALAQNPLVTSIEEDRILEPLMNESIPLIGADNAHTAGYTGDGFAVAVLDSGVDNDHAFLAGSVVSEACYSTTFAPNNSLTVCPGSGSEETGPDTGEDCGSINGCDHGTHVAGTVAGHNGPNGLTGVAPDAEIIAIQVFSEFTTEVYCGTGNAPCALTYTTDWIKGLERVHALHDDTNFTTPIAAVNMSLGNGNHSSTCDNLDGNTMAAAAAINLLVSDNIAVIVASGNDGYTNAVSFPACISSAISVGSSNDSTNDFAEQYGYLLDEVSSFSNNADFLDLLAPGAWIKSSVPGTAYESWTGTSMAAPHVAGAWAVIRQAHNNASVTDILDALRTSGVPITERRNGANNRIIPRIQIDAAIDELTTPQAPHTPVKVSAVADSSNAIAVSWDDQSFNEDNFSLERSTDGNNWTTVSDSIAADSTSYIDSGLTCGTTYEYRLRAENSHGSSAWSSTASAAPSEIETNTYTYTGSDVTITDDGQWTYVPITVPSTGNTITDIDVSFSTDHPCAWCIEAGILPSSASVGDEVVLVYRQGDTSSSFGSATFDDEATTPIASSSAPFSGSYQPEWYLSNLDNRTVDGDWYFFIRDITGGAFGVGYVVDGFSMTISEANGTCPANDPPVIDQGDGATPTMNEDAPAPAYSTTLSATDTEDDDSTLTWSISTPASHGSASIATTTGASTSVTYNPDADYAGTDSFVVTVTDSANASDTFTVDVTITEQNDPPVIDQGNSVTVNIEENSTLTASDLTLSAQDVEDDNSTLDWSIGTPASHGNASVDSATGASTGITYTPDTDYVGTDSFVVTVTDSDNDTDSITVNVNMNQAGNSAPDITEADPIAVTMSEDGIAADGTPDPFSLTLNATDADSDPLSWEISTEPLSGTANVDPATGASTDISYTPEANEYGSDSFGVTVTDGKGGGDTITVNVTITPVNDAPVIAEGDSVAVTIEENGALTATDLTLNATDVDHDNSTLDWSIGTPASHGNASVDSATGASTGITYTPDTDYVGTDSFVVQVADAAGGTASFAVTVTVQDNDPAGVSVSKSALTVSEIGSTDSYTVVLDSEPTSDVEIMVTSDDPGEATVSPAILIFGPSDWDTAQTVTVTGVDDDVDDGDSTVMISHSASSTDSDYDGISISDVTITVADNDSSEPTDTTPPDAPRITSPDTTDSPTPTISGTAEPSSTLRLTITLGIDSSVVYTTTVDADGTWSIDTATAAPVSGTFPASGLEDGTYDITARATDEAGNASAPTTQTLTVSKPGNPAVPVVTSGDTADSPYPTLSGTSEPGASITVVIDLGGGASVTYVTTADDEGTWSIDLANDTPTDGALPEGGLSDGTYTITVTATNETGSTSISHTLTVQGGATVANTVLYLPFIAR